MVLIEAAKMGRNRPAGNACVYELRKKRSELGLMG